MPFCDVIMSCAGFSTEREEPLESDFKEDENSKENNKNRRNSEIEKAMFMLCKL